MATDIVPTLFGVTPDSYRQTQQDRADAKAMQFAQLDPFQQANYAIGRGAYGLAGAVGGALGGQDPELQRISMRQQIAGQLNPNDLTTFDRGIEIMRRANDGLGAYMLQMERDKAQQLTLTRGDEALVRSDAVRKRAAEAALLKRQQEAQAIAQGAYVPGGQEVYGEDVMGQRVGEGITAPSFDIQRVAYELFKTAEGRAELKNLLDVQKSMRPETVSIKEGETIYSVPTTPGGAYKAIVSGGEKPTPFTGEMANAALTLYKTNDPTKIFKEFGQAGLDAVDKKAQQIALAKRPVTNVNLPNEGERKAATLANRLNFSVEQINQAIGIDPTAAMPNTSVEIARFLSRSEMIPNQMTSAQRQIVESAQLDILDAALTLGTGAAYTQAQLDGYRKSYFPQINDKPANVIAKRARLQNILRSAEIASGRAKVPTPMPSPGADLSSVITAPASK